MITKLNHLLPKFELTDKEEYEINNTSNKIIAILYPNNSVYKGMINSRGQREGFGKYYMADGSIYKGFFKNKDKSIGRIQLIIVTNEILNRKKIFNSLGMKFEKSYTFKKLKNDIDKESEKGKK